MKRRHFGAIDVGTTKVCSIIADSSDGELRILGVGIAPTMGLQKGLVVNINEARESIRRSVRKAEQTAGYRMESACIGVTGQHVSSLNNRGVVAITHNDQVVRQEDLQRVLQVARTVKVPNDSKLLHIIPRNYAIDDQDGIKNPVGMHGFRLDVETHIITAAATSIQNLTQCIHSLGIEIDDLILEALASGEAVLAPEERECGVILADIGGGTTDVAVFKDNSVFYTSVIPVAGYQITRDISIGLKLPFEVAEEMKIKYGNVMPIVDEANASKALTQNGQNVSHRELCDIIRLRVEELLRLIMLALSNAETAKLVSSGIVLTGGSANLPGISELATQVTKLPVRVGIPHNLYSISESLGNPAYATSVGLLLWKLRNEDTTNLPEMAGFRNFVSHVSRIFR
ncbi:MAG: cell division protein FtsA [Dehalococcoidales bacterium]|nr:cell division protein FtsA [Dehalococcoidales bacterium]